MSNSFNVPLKLDSESSDYKREVDDEQICSCCLAGGHLINMHDRFDNDGKMESYIDAVNQCYNSEILNPVELSGKRQICDDCIERLIDSYKFKRQIIEAQKSLVDYFDERDTTQEEDDLEKREIYVMLSSDDIKHDTDDVEMDHNFEAEVEYFDPDDPPYDTKLNVLNAVSNRSSTRLSRKNNKNVKSASTKSKKNISAKSRKASQKPTPKPPKASPSKSSSESVSKPKETRDPPLPRLKKPRVASMGKQIEELCKSSMDLENMQCRVCMEKFLSMQFLNRHMNEHFKNYVCDLCGRTCATQKRYRNHMRKHKTGTFNCANCDMIFDSLMKLDIHRKKHRSIFTCRFACGDSQPTYYLLLQHYLKAHGKGFSCEYCGVKMVNPSHLRKHISAVHMETERIFGCEYCHKRFDLKKSLTRHMKLHTSERNFICMLCEKRFMWKNNLVNHLKNHNVVKNRNFETFSCDHCKDKFVYRPLLVAHLRKHLRC